MDTETYNLLTKGKTNKQVRARQKFESQVNQAKHCRKKKEQVSCFSCPECKTCDIQQRLEEARSKM